MEVEAGFRLHRMKSGAAQGAVAQRDQAFKELDLYTKRLRAICRTAPWTPAKTFEIPKFTSLTLLWKLNLSLRSYKRDPQHGGGNKMGSYQFSTPLKNTR